MFKSMGFNDQKILDENDQINEKFFHQTIPIEKFLGWVAETDEGKIVATIGLVLDTHPPAPNNPSGKIGYIMNLAVDHEFRRQGIAKALMKTVLTYLKNTNINVAELHATEVARELYEVLGFKESNAMRIRL